MKNPIRIVALLLANTLCLGAMAQTTLLEALCNENPPPVAVPGGVAQRESATCEQAHRAYNPHRLYFDVRNDSYREFISGKKWFNESTGWKVRRPTADRLRFLAMDKSEAFEIHIDHVDFGRVDYGRSTFRDGRLFNDGGGQIRYKFVVCAGDGYGFRCVVWGRTEQLDGDGPNMNYGWMRGRSSSNGNVFGGYHILEHSAVFDGAHQVRELAHRVLECMTAPEMRRLVYAYGVNWPRHARAWCPGPNDDWYDD